MTEIRFEKRCRLCGESKPLTDFPRHRRRRDGHASDCKLCAAETQRAYRATPAGKVRSRAATVRSMARGVQRYDQAVAKLSPAEQAALGWTGPRHPEPTAHP